MAAWLLDWAWGRKLEAKADAARNVVIRKPASEGRAGESGIVLQCHTDMVPQAAAGLGHDFARDPIKPRLDPANPGWLCATGTTLGADNGIGMAMALALLEDESLEHGPLECLFTTCEEDGMCGAKAVPAGSLAGSSLVNLDGEDDGELTIGCAGSIRTAAELGCPAEPTPRDAVWLEAAITGLPGGHSGIDIASGRANATLALVRILSRAAHPIRLASLEGGSAANAIPREARALLAVDRSGLASFRSAFNREAASLNAEIGATNPGMAASLEPAPTPASATALGAKRSASLLSLIGGLPNGLVAMEPDMPGLIRTSLNLGKLSGRVDADSGNFRLSTLVMVRSSSAGEMEAVAAQVEGRLAAAGAAAAAGDEGWSVNQSRPAVSPAWTPDRDSPLLAASKAIYLGLFGSEPKVTSTHGGLECGLFRAAFPDWDMVSLGPKILYPHSPDERVEIASVARTYRFLRELVRQNPRRR